MTTPLSFCPHRRTARAVALSVLVALGLVATTSTALEQWDQLDEARQVRILFRLLSYDRALPEAAKDGLHLTVLSAPNHAPARANTEALQRAIERYRHDSLDPLPVTTTEVAFESLKSLERTLRESHTDLLYVTPGLGSKLPGIGAITRKLGILSITGSRRFVEHGLAVGLGRQGDRPRICVNLTALRSEGHDLPAKVLRLCQVYR